MIELLTTNVGGYGILGVIGLVIVFAMAMKPGTPLGWKTIVKRDYHNDTQFEHKIERMVAHKDEKRKPWWHPFAAKKGTIRKAPVIEEDDFGHKKHTGNRMLLANHCYYRTEQDPTEPDGVTMKVWCQDNTDVTELFEKGYTDREIKNKLL